MRTKVLEAHGHAHARQRPVAARHATQRQHFIDQGIHCSGICHVQRACQVLLAATLQGLLCGFQVQIERDDDRTLCGKLARDGPAHALASARHQRYFVFEFHACSDVLSARFHNPSAQA